MIKPFSFSELLARVEALYRRGSLETGKQETHLRSGPLEVDLLGRKVTANGEPVALQTREFNLLEFLIKHKGQVVTRTMLLEHVWDYHFDPQSKVIDVHISRLRKKIGDSAGEIIKTVRGAGYIIDDR